MSSRTKQYEEDLLYRAFLTEEIRVLTENTAIKDGMKVINSNFLEFKNKSNNTDNRTQEEIVSNISNKLEALGAEE